ncbi:basic salivary proline-rich protein 2-like [Penaeus japonicus]|uniref:basic salivary proline-rich protein 2-like n=1 Tax=Penaeus japonicus TaxID=27405 RepID=UPI001C711BFE|nr:basic salivary proline-rich protein 2-like [Penaeus japonicus]
MPQPDRRPERRKNASQGVHQGRRRPPGEGDGRTAAPGSEAPATRDRPATDRGRGRPRATGGPSRTRGSGGGKTQGPPNPGGGRRGSLPLYISGRLVRARDRTNPAQNQDPHPRGRLAPMARPPGHE